MYNFISLIIGITISIMISFNAKLSDCTGLYPSLVIIHFIGLIGVLVLMFFKRSKISLKNNLPLYFYVAGAISVFTVMFNNLTYSQLGVSVPLSLGLLGQLLTSLAIDHYGFLMMPKISFDNRKIIGILIIIIGIFIMSFS